MNDQSFPGNKRPAAGQPPDDADAPKDEGRPAHNSGRSDPPDQKGSGSSRKGQDWLSTTSSGSDRPDGYEQRLPSRRGPQVLEPRDDMPIDGFSPASAYGAQAPENAGLDLRKYLWLLSKHRWLILGSAALFLCLGFLVTFLTTPVYRATTTLQINRVTPNVTNVQNVDPSVSDAEGAEFYQTQYELLKSHTLAERVVSTLALQDDAAFLKTQAPSPWARLRQMIFGAPPNAASSAEDMVSRQKRAANRIRLNLGVEPVRNSSVVTLNYDDPNPAVAQKIANAIADSYISINLERRYEATDYARNFLQDRLQQLKQKLEESEKGVVAYAEEQHIVGDGDKQTLAESNLSAANQDLSKATTARLRADLLWQQAQASGDGLGLPQILQDESIQKLRANRADLATQYQDKLASFKPAYPEMKQLKSQMDELDRQIQAEVALIKNSIKAQYDAALSSEQSLAAQVEKLKGEVTDYQNRNIKYTILQREVDTNRQLYDGLLQRYKEIGVAGGVGINNISVVDKASLPEIPVKPSLPRNLGIALMLGLLAGAGAAFAREQLDDTFKSPEDLEEALGVPLLGMIPLADDAEDHVKLLQDPRSSMAEAYRSLRTALQFSTTSGIPKSLLITSSRQSEGKSTTAVTLAKNLAELGLRVLLIDADLRKPSLHKRLNLGNESGLTNCLIGAAVPPDVFQKTGITGLTFLASGPLPPNPVELLAGPKMLSLLTVGAEEYDVVVIDSPPVAGLADAPLLASMAIGTLLIVDAVATRRGAAKATLKRLHFARAQMVGAVINKVDLSHRGYGYGYGYAYGYAGYYGEDTQPLTKAQPSLKRLFGGRKDG